MATFKVLLALAISFNNFFIATKRSPPVAVVYFILPLLIFTLTYFYTRDIFFATLILLIGLFFQMCLEYFLEKKFI